MEVIQGNTININIKPYLISRGWTVEGNVLKHSSENGGEAIFKNYNVLANSKYIVSFNVDKMTSGFLSLSIGGVKSTNITTNGYHQFEFNTVNDSKLSFYSNGDLELLNIGIVLQTSSFENIINETIAYSELRRGWVSFRSYVPESGVSINSEMFTFKEGDMWIHTDLSTPNNFYRRQYYSTIKFPVTSVNVKSYNSIAVHSNKIIGTTLDGIVTELGDTTDLINYDFTTKEGIHYANLLRDSLTENSLEGRYIVIELSDEETPDKKLQLFKVVVKSNISTPNE